MTNGHYHQNYEHGGEIRRRAPRRPGFDSGFSGGPGFGPEAFGPFVPGHRRGGWAGRARRGDVRAVILSILAEGPNTGYGLIKQIEERSEGTWRPSPGSVYPTLQQLVDEGLIVASGGDGRSNEYSITEAGTAHVAEHAEDITRAWQGGSVDRRTQFAEAFAYREAAVKLNRAVGQFAREATPAQLSAAAPHLDSLRKTLYGILAE